MIRILLASTLLLAAACPKGEAALGDPSFVRETQYVTVHAYGLDPSQACAGSLANLDIHTRWVMDIFGLENPTRFNYRWISNHRWNRIFPPPPPIPAFVTNGEPHTRWLPDMHEIVHMVASALPQLRCPPLLEEGLAEYLGDPEFGEVYPSGTVEELMIRRDDLSPGAYARAAHFVSFLTESYGVAAIVDLCQAVGPADTRQAWEDGVARALSVSLDQLLTQYQAYPLCHQQQLRARAWECGGEIDHVFTEHDKRFAVEEVGCSDPRAVNVVAGRRRDVALRRLVSFPEPMIVSVNADPGVIFITQECGPCSAQPQVQQAASAQRKLFSFRPGVHEIIAIFNKDEQVSFEMIGLY
jgi:hypothetical protein